MNYYSVNGKEFSEHFEAVKYAISVNAQQVIVIKTGSCCWEPPAPVSKKRMKQRMKRYREQKNAYEAYKRHFG